MLDIEKPIYDDSLDYTVINIYEELVKQSVISMAEYMEMCKCGKCISDVCALVLNQLTPHYVTTRKGEILSRLSANFEPDNQANITVKVVQALHLVNESPRH
ncbi:MAG: late competence development ComFB family protein [Defluviitaleaceae bacterium]|nr:late competence development ComFB family protein [Defluviitaleaceae bacterium]